MPVSVSSHLNYTPIYTESQVRESVGIFLDYLFDSLWSIINPAAPRKKKMVGKRGWSKAA